MEHVSTASAPTSDRLERRADAGHRVCRLVAPGEGRLNIQALIADLAARFLSAAPDSIDDTVQDGLRLIGEALRLDRALLWQASTHEAIAVTAYRWDRHPQPSLPDGSQMACIPWIASKLEAGEAVWFSRIDEVCEPADREPFLRCGFVSAAVVPMAVPDGVFGDRSALAFGSMTERDWSPAVIEQLRLVSGVLGQALARQATSKALHRALAELRRLRARTEGEGRSEKEERLCSSVIVGQSAAIRHVLEQARQVAATDSTVLLLGETGTGKELIASLIHELSGRRGRGMVRVNCSAIPGTLIESELFGREKGAYTGALARQIGRFELADRSTIFLDEIGDLPMEVQVKLLRVLEERQIERLGSPRAVQVDVRIVAATHRDLEKRIVEGAFREDLFYRLNVFPIQVPPLRDRPEDIPLLVWRFVDEFSRSFGKRIEAIPGKNMAALQQYAWPGNIRELRNVVERAMIVARAPQLTIALPPPSRTAGKRSVRLADVEREHVRSVLESSGWRIRGTGGAAERLGLRPTTLETRMGKLGLSRPKALAGAGSSCA